MTPEDFIAYLRGVLDAQQEETPLVKLLRAKIREVGPDATSPRQNDEFDRVPYTPNPNKPWTDDPLVIPQWKERPWWEKNTIIC